MDSRHLFLVIVMCLPHVSAAEEFQINVRTAGNQCNPAVVTSIDGRLVAVWNSYYSSSGRSNEIMARLIDPVGSVVTDEFQVNVNRQGSQTEPAVAVRSDGSLLVVWQGPGVEEDKDIFARLLTANGSPTTNDMTVNTDTSGDQIYPRAAVDADGDAIVVWESRPIDASGGHRTIRAQQLDPNGALLGDEIWIDEDGYDCRYPDVAMETDGSFVVVWLQDRSNKTIRARLFDPTGAPLTDSFDVSTDDIASVTRPSLAIWTTGEFVVAWDGDPDRASQDDIHARCFDAKGLPHTEAFVVNEQRDGAQQWPRVAASDTGTFVVVWEHDWDDKDRVTDISARCFDRSGFALGSQMQLNEVAVGKQRSPDVAITADGAPLAIWESNDQDGSGYGLFGRIAPLLPVADLNADAVVDFRDVGILAHSWCTVDESGWGDLTGDTWIDARDLKVLCHQWLE